MRTTRRGFLGGVASASSARFSPVAIGADALKTDAPVSTPERLGQGGAINEDIRVAFTQLGSGAVTRTLQEKVQEVISVKDFGAAGDNVSDDTAAFQAAIDYCARLGGGTVLIPAGKYYIATTLNMKTSVRILGAGRGYDTGGTELHAKANLFRFTGQLNCAIEQLLVYGLHNTVGSALYFDTGNTGNLYVSNIVVRNMYSAIYCESTALITVAKFHFCKFIYNRNWHVELLNGVIWNCVTFDNCEFDAQSNAAKAGLFRRGAGSLGYTYFKDCLFQASASAIAVDLASSCFVAFTNCLFFYSAPAIANGCSINIGGGSGQVSLRNCSLAGPGVGATNFNHILKASTRSLSLVIQDSLIEMGTNITNLVSTNFLSAVAVRNCTFLGTPVAADYDMLSSAGFDVVRTNNKADTSRSEIVSDIVTTLKTKDAIFATIQGGSYVVRPSTNYLYSAEITARNPSGTVYYAGVLRHLFSVAADKTITDIGNMDQVPITSGGTLSVRFTFPSSGGAAAGIAFQVRGIAAITVNWVCRMSIIPVGEAAGLY